MSHQISVPLNRQQLELIDRTVALGLAPSRSELLKLALREHRARQEAASAQMRPAEPQQ